MIAAGRPKSSVLAASDKIASGGLPEGISMIVKGLVLLPVLNPSGS
jgi:hypothetical protein